MKDKDPDKVLKKAVEKTIDIVATYVEPGPRNAETTVEKVIETVDNDEVKAAVEASDQRREATRQAMNSQHPEREADQDRQDDQVPERKERRDRAAGNE